MSIRALLLLAASSVVLSGCTTPLGLSNYQRVGAVGFPAGRFLPNPDYSPPTHFSISTKEVVSTFGHLCRANYNCTYFADDSAYYLLQNYGVVPSLSIPTHAVAIVDGRTGKLLKAP
jgi:hypothetical protein